jgi:hypothetical protein
MYSVQAISRVAAIALAGSLALTLLAGCGDNPPAAAMSPYEFSALSPDVSVGGGAVDVRLIHKPTGKPVTDAVIFETRFDMEPEGMAAMAAQATAQGSPAPGVYRFAVKPTMDGRWALKLSAKVQGEAETVRGSVVVTAR